MDELEFEIRQNSAAITRASLKVNTYMQDIPTDGQACTDWTDGFVARDVAWLTALLEKQTTLVEALNMIKRAGQPA